MMWKQVGSSAMFAYRLFLSGSPARFAPKDVGAITPTLLSQVLYEKRI